MKEYEFFVDGIMCEANCKPRIAEVLLAMDGVHTYDITVLNKRVKVTVGDEITPDQLIKQIRKAGDKYKATLVTDKGNQVFSFGLIGLLEDSPSCRKIEEKIKNSTSWPNIKSCKIQYATHVLTIEMVNAISDPQRAKETQEQLKAFIESSEANMRVEIIPSSPVEEGKNAAAHFHKALINLGVTVLLMIGGSVFAFPIVGMITFATMWVTGKEFYRDAWEEFKARSSNMSTLITLGTGSAWVFSMLGISQSFLAGPMIMGILHLGQSAKARALEATAKEVKNLHQVRMEMQPRVAARLKRACAEEVSKAVGEDLERIIKNIDLKKDLEFIHYNEIKKDDFVLVRAGQRIPVDGTAYCDEAFIKQEAITGESTPTDLKIGIMVNCGSKMIKDTIVVRATVDGGGSWLNGMLEKVAESASKPPPHPEIINKIAKWFTPFILSVAGISGFWWVQFGTWMQAAQVMSAVLLCACPCIIGLILISYAAGVHAAAANGILIKKSAALDSMGNKEKKAVIFDKTGTLTQQIISDVFVDPAEEDLTVENVIQHASAVEQIHAHRSFADAFARRNIQPLLSCENAREIGHQGVSGKVAGRDWTIGNTVCLDEERIDIPDVLRNKEDAFLKSGRTAVFIAVDKKCVAVVGLKHELRAGAEEAVRAMHNMGMTTYMFTGDAPAPALQVAKDVGIAEGRVFPKLTPQEKLDQVKILQQQGYHTILVGDGVNDCDAMGGANASIALGASANAAMASDVIVPCLSLVPKVFLIAKETLNNVFLNYCWAFGYNFLALSAATGLLYPLTGIVLTPVAASALMALSSLFILLNVSRLPLDIDIALGESKPLSLWQHVKNFFSPTALCRIVALLIGMKPTEKLRSQAQSLPPAQEPEFALSSRPMLIIHPRPGDSIKPIVLDDASEPDTSWRPRVRG